MGEDGNPAFGQAFAFTDNGDGTITDGNTGLIWEKRDAGPSSDLHAVGNIYPWRGTRSGSTSPDGECGTDADCPTGQSCNATDGQSTGLTIFKWVAALNAANFAGQCGWRIPNVRELASIVDYRAFLPAVTLAFQGSGCSASCTDLTDPNCSCTASGNYWSATTITPDPEHRLGPELHRRQRVQRQ